MEFRARESKQLRTELRKRLPCSTATAELADDTVLLESLKNWPRKEVPNAVQQTAHATGDGQFSVGTHKDEALSEDQRKLLAYDARLRRELESTKQLMIVESWLAVVAVLAALFVATSWPFVVWALVELGLILHGAAACRRLRRVINCVQMDLASDVVRQSVGRVRSFRIFWRVVEDGDTNARYLIASPLIRPSTVCAGDKVSYRAAARSRVVLSLDQDRT